MSNLDLSIVIVNWNTQGYLRDCLQSIKDKVSVPNLEIIVVDNASTDGSVQMVRADFPEVVLVVNQTNVGFGAANNQAFRVAQGKKILMLNSDTKVLTDLAPLLDILDRRSDIGLLGCKILNDDGSIQLLCARPFPTIGNKLINYIRIGFPLSTKFLGRQDGYSDWDYADEREVDVILGAFMMFRREVLETIGELDYKTFFMYAEDVDWCKKAHLAGLKVIYSPVATILHYGNKSSVQIPGKTGYLRVQSLARYFDRYHGKLYGLWFRFLVFVVALIGITPAALARLTVGKSKSKLAQKINQVYLIFAKVVADPLLRHNVL
jgi:GT2 family glycosyltransferase